MSYLCRALNLRLIVISLLYIIYVMGSCVVLNNINNIKVISDVLNRGWGYEKI